MFSSNAVRRWTPRRLAVSSVLGVLALSGLAAGAAYATGSTVTTTDAVTRTLYSTYLSPTRGTETTVSSLALPAGNWIIHTDDSAVGLNQPSDVVRCWIVGPDGVHVGHATHVGNAQSYPIVAGLSDTVGLKLTAPATVYNTCSHDTTNGGTYYIDGDATMSAHRAQSLTITTVP